MSGKQLRGEALVNKVLEVAADEMMRADYASISIESIASAAGVNKTTLYRRWGTLDALVRDAGDQLLATLSPPKDTGSFRNDLTHYFRGVRELLIALRLRTPSHIKLPGGAPRELEKIRLSFEKKKGDELRAIFRRATTRGEIPPGVDFDLISNVLAGAVLQLTLFTPHGCDDEKIADVIDLVLCGVAGRRAKESSATARRPAAKR